MFVTYELEQTGSDRPPVRAGRGKKVKVAEKHDLPGGVVHWQVGEFENAAGAKTYGVLVEYSDLVAGGEALISVPPNAQNVQIHTHSLPDEYRAALKG